MEDPLLLVVHGQQHAVARGLGDVADDEVLVARHLAEELAAEGDADVVEQVSRTGVLDAESLAHGAAGTVGGEEVVGTHGVGLTGVPGLQDGVHPVGVLGEGQQLGAEAHVSAEAAGALEQYRLQVVLAARAPDGRAHAVLRRPAGQPCGQPAAVSAVQGVHLEVPWFLDSVAAACRIAGSRPAVRNSSIVRMLLPLPRGCAEVAECRSTTRCCTPSLPRKTDAEGPRVSPPRPGLARSRCRDRSSRVLLRSQRLRLRRPLSPARF